MNPMISCSIDASFIGNLAQRHLSMSSQASIMGVNSGGIYIKTNRNWVLYISGSPYRGPLTIGIDHKVKSTRALTPGMAVDIQPTRLTFPGAELAISTANSHVWEPEPPNLSALPLAEQFERWKTLALAIHETRPESDLEYPLKALLIGLDIFGTYAQVNGLIRENFLDSTRIPGRSKFEDTAKILSKLLGKGQGLTPGGDDLVAGVLLSLNRWNLPGMPAVQREAINRETIRQAYQKTTTLSANLIECAASGLADERLINALDWIKCGSSHKVRTLIDGLLGWGNTSGISAYIGFLFALNIQEKK
jgi:hypothetical protein